MRRITNYNLDKQKVTALVADDTGTYYLIIGIAKNSSNVCELRRVSANDLNQLYSNVDVEAEEITRLVLSGNYLYSAVDHATNLGYRHYKYSLIASVITFTAPGGINESAIDVLVDGSFVYFLIPGSASGETAKLVKFTTSGTYQETIELQKSGEEVRNAKSFTSDSSGNFWVITNTSPSKLVRVFDDGGWDFTVTTLVP